jgi:RNA polymerase sigma-70 factor (ECF subfamily)
MIFGLCRLLLRDPVEAEDATQQVFLAAHRCVTGGFRPREPGSWLAAIARNECRARIRSRMRTRAELPFLAESLPDPVAAAVRTADLDALWQALAALPRRQRKAFLLREVGGLSYRELGIALGVTQPAVESLLFRARKRLRDTLTAASAATVPTPVRDQLARLLPALGPSSPAATTAKCAAVAVGLGLGTAGVAELPRRHAPPHRVEPRPLVDLRQRPRPGRATRATAPARVIETPVAFVSRAHRRSGGDARGPRGPALRESQRDAEEPRHERRERQPDTDRQPPPSPAEDGAGGVAAGPEVQRPQERQEQEEEQEQGQEQEQQVQPRDDALASPPDAQDGSSAGMTSDGDGGGGTGSNGDGSGGRDGDGSGGD